MKAGASFRCPICRKSVAEKSTYFPFCSKRCRMVDLGKWLREDYRIARPAVSEDGEDEEGLLTDGEGE